MDYSRHDFQQQFSREEDCLRYIFETVHQSPTCQNCKKINAFYFNKSNKCFTCSCGKTHIYPKKGTLFDHSGIKITKWFLALYEIANKDHTISELAKELGVDVTTNKAPYRTYKSILNLIERHWKPSKQISPAIKAEVAKLHKTIKDRKPYEIAAQFREEYKSQGRNPFLVLLDMALDP